MEDCIKETLIASPYPFWLTVLIFALVTGLVQYLVFYFKEKGKNLATKEDIGKITKEIESVKNIYSSSLEKYKMELQKEYESTKYIIDFCNKLDKTLIELLVESKNGLDIIMKKDYSYSCTKKYTELIKPLCTFLDLYSTRYSSNENAKAILHHWHNYTSFIEEYTEAENYYCECEKSLGIIKDNINHLLVLFLPKIPTNQT